MFPPQLLKHIVLLRVQAFPAASADLKEQVHNALHGFGHFLTDLCQPFVEVYTRAIERAAVTSMWRSFEEETVYMFDCSFERLLFDDFQFLRRRSLYRSFKTVEII